MATKTQKRGALRSGDFSPRAIAALFVLLSIVAAVPVLTHPLVPLGDYANHLARMHVISTIGSDPLLARFYEIEWAVIPNLIMDLVVPVLERFMNIYAAGQIFVISIFVLTLSGTLALNRALYGYWSAMPLISFPLLYNGVLLVGVMNYLFGVGVGVALWALASWIGLRDRAWPLRYFMSLLFVLLLFFCHLFAVGVYGVGLLAFEMYRQWQTPGKLTTRRYLEFMSAGLPFLVVLPLLYLSPTLQLVSTISWEADGKVDGIKLVFETYYDLIAIILAAIVVAAGLWAMRYRVLHFHRFGWFLLAVGGVVYLAMPRVIFATYLADQRLPIGLAFMVAACLHLELTRKAVRQAFAAVLFVLLAIRVAEVEIVWRQLSGGTLEFRNSVNEIARGSRVLVVYADASAGEAGRDLPYIHAACLAMIEKSSLVTTAFTVEGKQILQTRNKYSKIVDTDDGTPPSLGQFILATEVEADEADNYWDNWPTNFDYVYLLFTEPGAVNPDTERLELVKEGPRFQLYKVIRPAPDKTPDTKPDADKQKVDQPKKNQEEDEE
ncbi:MAG: hypothetical protein KF807_14085 [Xanthobacteraceae bacterium]|nr:hypothetical protein [Xanthobacteraceae bacterium]